MKKICIIVPLLFAVNTIFAQSVKTTPASQSKTYTPAPSKKLSPEAKEIRDTHVKSSQVPTVILNKFAADYPEEQPVWSMDGANYRAGFVEESKMKGHAVAYDKKGNRVYSEEVVTKDIPSGVKDYFDANAPKEIYEVWMSTDKDGKKTYYANHNLQTHWFEDNGKHTGTTKLRQF